GGSSAFRRQSPRVARFGQQDLGTNRHSANLLRPHRPRYPPALSLPRNAAPALVSLYFCHPRPVNAYLAAIQGSVRTLIHLRLPAPAVAPVLPEPDLLNRLPLPLAPACFAVRRPWPVFLASSASAATLLNSPAARRLATAGWSRFRRATRRWAELPVGKLA